MHPQKIGGNCFPDKQNFKIKSIGRGDLSWILFGKSRWIRRCICSSNRSGSGSRSESGTPGDTEIDSDTDGAFQGALSGLMTEASGFAGG
jgi:hypothetical protein